MEQILKVIVKKDEEKQNCAQEVKREYNQSQLKGVAIWQIFDTAKAKALQGRACKVALALRLCWTTALITQSFPISCQAGSACTQAYPLQVFYRNLLATYTLFVSAIPNVFVCMWER